MCAFVGPDMPKLTRFPLYFLMPFFTQHPLCLFVFTNVYASQPE